MNPEEYAAVGRSYEQMLVPDSLPRDTMSYTAFKKAWDASGLPEYYERMDHLHWIGFTFDSNGDMDRYESLALREWLTEDRDITGVGLDELDAAKTGIMDRAAQLRQEDSETRLPDPTNCVSFTGHPDALHLKEDDRRWRTVPDTGHPAPPCQVKP